jgi:transcriptional regulator with XRE-family HTH domain
MKLPVRVEVFALGRSQGRVAFLPFTKVSRKASAERALPVPVTIGEHIRANRSERKLLQRDVAAHMGVAPETISCWEKSATTPPARLMPAIIRFLGYDPTPEPTTLPERMRHYRRKNGLTIKEAAHRMGVDESSWGQWERTGLIRWERYRTLVDEFLSHGSRR